MFVVDYWLIDVECVDGVGWVGCVGGCNCVSW